MWVQEPIGRSVGFKNLAAANPMYLAVGPFPAGAVFREVGYSLVSVINLTDYTVGWVVSASPAETVGNWQSGDSLIQRSLGTDHAGQPVVPGRSSRALTFLIRLPVWYRVTTGSMWVIFSLFKSAANEFKGVATVLGYSWVWMEDRGKRAEEPES